MSYIEVDDGILDHPKFIRAAKLGGSEAIHLWLGLRAYVAKLLTDGFIPDDMLDEVRGPRETRRRAAALKVLTDVGLLDKVDGGMQLHDYLDWSKSREQILELRRINGVRSALRASPQLMLAIKERDQDRCRYCSHRVDWKDRRGPLGGTYDHVVPLSKGGDNHIENIVVACRACNSRKQNRTGMVPLPTPVNNQEPTGRNPVTEPGPSPHLSTPLPVPSVPSERGASAPAARRAQRTRRFPDFEPTPEHMNLALQIGADLPTELAKFRDHEFRDPKSDANACFRSWLRRSIELKRSEIRTRLAGGNRAADGLEQQMARVRTLEAAEAAELELERKALNP